MIHHLITLLSINTSILLVILPQTLSKTLILFVVNILMCPLDVPSDLKGKCLKKLFRVLLADSLHPVWELPQLKRTASLTEQDQGST